MRSGRRKTTRLGARDAGDSRSPISFRLKLMVLAVAVAMVPLAVVGLLVHRITERQLTEHNQELLFAVLDDVATTLGTSFTTSEELLRAAAASLADSDFPVEQRIRAALSIVAGSESLEQIGVYDASGRWLDTIHEVDQVSAPLPKTLQKELIDTADKTGFAVSEVRVDQGNAASMMVVPVRGSQETWYVTTWAPLSSVQDRVREIVNQRLQPHHRLIVIDNRFTVLASGGDIRVGEVVTAERLGALKGLEPGAVDEGLLYFGTFETTSERSVGAVQTLKRLPWAVVVELPYGDAFSSLVLIRNFLLAIVVVATVLAAAAGVVMAWRITRPIKTLLDFAEDLASRRFESRVHIATRDELSLLGDALSDAAAELQASDEKLRNEEAIRVNLGRYLPSRLVDEIVRRKSSVELGGQRRVITVLFADVVGFTPLAEKHGAGEVVTILNELFTVLSEVVFRHEGTIDKFIGDCIMAFWGAPDPQDDHAARAVAAAIDMLRWLEVLNAGWKEAHGQEIEIAIGLHTGDAVVGNFGSQERMAYTAIGDTVNVAARLEVIARPQQILVSQATRDAVGDLFEFAPIGEQRLAGRSQPVSLYEVLF